MSSVLDHPGYDGDYKFHDISIMTLARPITYSAVAAPVCLPASVSSLYTGEVATTTGWGTTSFGGSLAPTLREVEVTVVSNGQCSNSYSGIQKYHSNDNSKWFLLRFIPFQFSHLCC